MAEYITVNDNEEHAINMFVMGLLLVCTFANQCIISRLVYESLYIKSYPHLLNELDMLCA